MLEPIIEQINQLPIDQLQSLSDTILEMIDDRKWGALFNSPKATAFEEKYDREHKDEEIIEYIPGKSIADHFRQEV